MNPQQQVINLDKYPEPHQPIAGLKNIPSVNLHHANITHATFKQAQHKIIPPTSLPSSSSPSPHINHLYHQAIPSVHQKVIFFNIKYCSF